MQSHQGPRVALKDLRDALGERAFGVLLFVFALPNLLPNIPGMSTIFAIPLLFLSWQFSYGRPSPWFPRWLAERNFAREDFIGAVERVLPTLERFERLLRPRLPWMFGWLGERLIGVALFVLSFVILLPIPLGNWLPALSIAIVGLAIVERDGQAATIGLATGVAALAVVSAVLVAMAQAFIYFLQHAFA